MSYENPYSPPQADVSDPANEVASELLESPRGNPIGHGWAWLAEGFSLFRAEPGIWIANLILLIVILIVLALVPFIGTLTQYLLSAVFTGGLMLGCFALDRGDSLQVEHLFAGFKQRPGALIGVGLISLVGTIIAVVVAMAVSGAGMTMAEVMFSPEFAELAESGDTQAYESLEQLMPVIWTATLLMMAVMIPLMMALWFAPPLLVRHEDVGLFQAIKLSFIGCLKNILPLFWYGIVLSVLAILATLPLGLGWLVLGPMIYGSIYAGYKDIFLE